MVIRKADPSDDITLSELTFKSKSYWNYPEEYMKVWEQELTVTDDYIKQNIVYVVENNGIIIGYYSIKEVKDEYWSGETPVQKGFWLDNLFILPEFIGNGIGRKLIEHVKGICRNIGCKKIYIFSDPHAQGFYLKQGAKFIKDCPSSIEGRTIPMMELNID
jgi:GNAT superfamily N-acetyltransferase